MNEYQFTHKDNNETFSKSQAKNANKIFCSEQFIAVVT